MSLFKEDRLDYEKEEPTESSSMTYINIPLVLLALLMGFGITYLALETKHTSMSEGDSRTVHKEVIANSDAAPGAGNEAGGEMDMPALMTKGKQVYTSTCQACHQTQGDGITGAFPPLAASDWVTGSPRRVIAIILHGIQGEITVEGQKYNGLMPPFKDQLKTDDIAAVTTYIRNSFGNKADMVSLKLVEEVLDSTKSKTGAWAGEAELNSQSWD